MWSNVWTTLKTPQNNCMFSGHSLPYEQQGMVKHSTQTVMIGMQAGGGSYLCGSLTLGVESGCLLSCWNTAYSSSSCACLATLNASTLCRQRHKACTQLMKPIIIQRANKTVSLWRYFADGYYVSCIIGIRSWPENEESQVALCWWWSNIVF